MTDNNPALGLMERIAARAQSAATMLRVKSALNPMLWLCGIVTLPCFDTQNAEVNRQHILDYFASAPDVLNWRAVDGAIFIVTELPQDRLANLIAAKFPLMRFVVAAILRSSDR